MPLTTHRAIEFAIGLTLVAVPLVLAVSGTVDSGAAAVLVTPALGAVLTFMGISERREGGALGATAHQGADRVMALLLSVAGVVMLAAGDFAIGLLCAIAGLLEGALLLTTRYSARARGV